MKNQNVLKPRSMIKLATDFEVAVNLFKGFLGIAITTFGWILIINN